MEDLKGFSAGTLSSSGNDKIVAALSAINRSLSACVRRLKTNSLGTFLAVRVFFLILVVGSSGL